MAIQRQGEKDRMGKYKLVYFQVAGAVLALLALVVAVGGDMVSGP